jgi:ribose transport system substrate-binding protein
MTTVAAACDQARADLPLVRIGIVEKNQHSFWDSENAGWRDAAARLGLSVDVKAPVEENLDEQRAMMLAHLDNGVDVLGFVGMYPDAFTDIVTEATRRGVVTLCFDLDAPASGRALYVGMEDPYTMGRWAGQHMASLFTPGAKTIGVLTGSDMAAGARGKLGGFTDYMTEHGHRIVGGANDHEDVPLARDNCRELILAHPEIDALYGVYSYHTAVEAQITVELALNPKPVIFGWDILPETIEYLQAGVVDMAVWIKEYYFGFYAAAAAANLVRLGTAEGLELMGMDANHLELNRLCPEAQIITPATVARHIEWRRAHHLDGQSRLPL